jgi:hypothetical protein
VDAKVTITVSGASSSKNKTVKFKFIYQQLGIPTAFIFLIVSLPYSTNDLSNLSAEAQSSELNHSRMVWLTTRSATAQKDLSNSALKNQQQQGTINGKDEQSLVLPPCRRCRATMDLKLLEHFASRHISDDGRLYYCNNPICPPDEWERKQRLLPFSFS